MKILKFESAEQVGQAAAALIAGELIRKPESVLGLAYGNSPIPTYRALTEMYRGGELDFSEAQAFVLDEYIGLPPENKASIRHFMNETLFDQVNIAKKNVHVPDGMAADPAAEALAYEQSIFQAGGMDLQLLGIGRNGHVGFNEPGDRFIVACHAAKLAESTLEANQHFFGGEKAPEAAITVGIGGIMKAKFVLLIATGADKADAVAAAAKGDVVPDVPASVLQLHRNCLFMIDQAAAAKL